MRRVALVVAAASIAALAATVAPASDTQLPGPSPRPEAFGFNAAPQSGARPLVTILVDYSDAKFLPEHTPEFYRRLLFGPPGREHPSIAAQGGWIGENSHRRFSFTNAGVIGPFTVANDPSTPFDESSFDCTNPLCSAANERQRIVDGIRLAAANGFDFSRYATGGGVSTRQLTVVVIGANAVGDFATVIGERPGARGGVVAGRENERFVRLEGYGAGPGPGRSRLVSYVSGARGDVWTRAEGSVPARGATLPPNYAFNASTGPQDFVFDAPQGDTTVPLHQWFSRRRGDYYLTSDPAWRGAAGARRAPDWTWVRVEGHVYRPDRPRPRGALPLNTYESQSDTGVLAAYRPMCVAVGPTGRQTQVCTGGVIADESVDMMTMAHEIMHEALGALDLYNPNPPSRANYLYSAMGATLSGIKDFRGWSHHLDPFYKFVSGWISPTLVPLSATGCYPLRAIELAPSPSPPAMYLLYDPARSTREFLLLEFRRAQRANYDGDPWTTGAFGLPDDGLAIWRINIDAAGVPRAVAGGQLGVQIVGPGGAPGLPGTNGAWSSGDGAARPTWSDGSQSGFVIRNASPSDEGDQITVQIGATTNCGVPVPPPSRCSVRATFQFCTVDLSGVKVVRQTPLLVPPGARVPVVWQLDAPVPVGQPILVRDVPSGGTKGGCRFTVRRGTKGRITRRCMLQPPRTLGRVPLGGVVSTRGGTISFPGVLHIGRSKVEAERIPGEPPIDPPQPPPPPPPPPGPPPPPPQDPGPGAECNDGFDNDGDQSVDMDDAGCSDPADTDESN